jgi:hypothetical protein
MKLSEAYTRAIRIADEVHIAPKCKVKFVAMKVREFYCEVQT